MVNKNLEKIKSKKVPNVDCPVTYCMSIIGGKWKPIILFLISKGANRFGILQKGIDGISKQVLTTQLRELENDGILERKMYAEVPPKVEYFITSKGESIFSVIHAMKNWGEENM
ncbi:MAG: helix-turn-helix transcriptional regulator [Cytophagales bacterium]|nr:helix-turn-helix transcriptional regulator [Cytophagales bacterium]